MKKVAKLGLLILLFISIINYANNIYAADQTERVTQLSFDGNKLKNINIQDIERYTELEKLAICNYKLEDLTFLKNLSNLKELKINNCGLSEIQDLDGLVNLTKLDLGYNQISDITSLKNLSKLEKLSLNKNQITDISSLENLTRLTGLDLSSNEISNIVALKNLKQLALVDKDYDISVFPLYLIKLVNFEHLYLDDNQIADISMIDEAILKYTSVQRQRLVVKTNKKEIEIPNFFKSEKVDLINCKFNNDRTKIIIEETGKNVSIKSKEGIFCESILTVEYDINEPSLMIIYSDTNDNNQKATVTITADEEIKSVEGWTLAENKRKLIKEYTKNTTEQLKVYDIAGNETNVTIEVKNINKPILNTTYSIMEDKAVSKGEKIIEEADKYVGKIPYVLQGDSLTDGIDCSHFVYRILQICGLYSGKYMRSTNWINVGAEVQDLEHAIAGDIIVWDGHVGFYDGNGKIVEAKGSKWGITHDRDAAKAIEKETFLGIRRITGNEKVERVINLNEVTESDIKVTINSNKSVQAIKGWNLSKDGKTLTKTYSKNANEKIIIKDFEGNEVEKIINISNIVK